MISSKSWLGSLAFCSLFVVGCGNDSSRNATVLTPPELKIQSIVGAGASGWSTDQPSTCVDLGKDTAETIVVQTKITGDWLLRPYGDCDNGAQCGFVEIDVSDSAGNTVLSRAAASDVVNLPFKGIANSEGALEFKARLVTGDGKEFFLGDGGTICNTATDCAVTVEVRRNCATTANDAGVIRDAGANDASEVSDGSIDTTPPDATTHRDATTPAPDDAASLDASKNDAALDAAHDASSQ